MTTPEITETILAAKGAKGVSFGALGALIGRDEVWVAAVAYRQASASTEEAEKLTAALGLGPDVAEVYRFYEIMQVYGMPIKAIIHERFGDGIMSAIDFTLAIDREKDPKGDRVKITMSGKFLPYKKW